MYLTKSVIVTIQPEVTKEIQEVTISRIDDFPDERFVRVIINELPGEITLWSDDNYDPTCAWTLTDVEARIEELLVPKVVENGE